MLRSIGRTVRDLWIYFKAGHSGYLVYTMSIMNFIVLQHRLLISYIPLLSQYLSRLSTFFFLFIGTYMPLAVVIGYFEFRKGEAKRRHVEPLHPDQPGGPDQDEHRADQVHRRRRGGCESALRGEH